MQKTNLTRRAVSKNASLYSGGLVNRFDVNSHASLGQLFVVSDDRRRMIPCTKLEYDNWAKQQQSHSHGCVVLKFHEQHDYRLFWFVNGECGSFVLLESKDVMSRGCSDHEWSTMYALRFDSPTAASMHFGKVRKRLAENESRIVSSEQKLRIGHCYDVLCHAAVGHVWSEANLFGHKWCGLVVSSKSVATEECETFIGRLVAMDVWDKDLCFIDEDCIIASCGDPGEAMQRIVVSDGNHVSLCAVVLAKSSQDWAALVKETNQKFRRQKLPSAS